MPQKESHVMFREPLTRAEVLEIIANGENSAIEFKRDDIEISTLAKELVAFSNLYGGMVLLGVEDNGAISGINKADIEEFVMAACRDKIRPAIIPFFEIVRNIEPGKDIAVVRVGSGFDVHGLLHNNRTTYLVRVGSQSREATQQELARLFQQRGAFRAELRPISGAHINDLDVRRLRDYFRRVRKQDTPADNDEKGWETLLFNAEIIVEQGVTAAALLLFGKNPNRFLPQAGINAVAFPGKEKDYAARERTRIRGAMVPLGVDVESGIVDQAVYFVVRNMPVRAYLENNTRRVENYAYPKDVVREAIVNALIHRDYLLSGTDIELSLYDGRLEIISPGRLPNGITAERMRTGCRATRNQLLRDVMWDYGYVENTGMGVPRKIVRGMREHNGSEPDLVEDEDRFIVRLLDVSR